MKTMLETIPNDAKDMDAEAIRADQHHDANHHQ